MQEKYINQKCHPSGIKGRKLLNTMNESHNDLSLWGISHLGIKKDSKILDIGCGNGNNIKKFLEITENIVYGLDISKLSCRIAIKTNKKAINYKQCKIFNEDILHFEYKNSSFDIITAFCTLRFWKNIKISFQNIYNLLTQNGTFLICDHGRYDVAKVLKDLSDVGFKEVKLDKKEPNFVSIIAVK